VLEQDSDRGGPLVRVLRRIGFLPFAERGILLLIALLWFVAVFSGVLWVWGLNPVVFPSSDEACVRYAADLIAKGQGPFLNLPMPDPEDLLHPRSWLSLGARATPSYAPVSFYLYGWLLRLHGFGLVLLAALPASGAAALAAGAGRLLPVGRRWLGFAAPALAFPTLYWLMRPWINMSPCLIGLCWSVLCWASWRDTSKLGWLAAALFSVGYSAAVRPDYAAYLFVLALLLSVAARPAQWKPILGLVMVAGVLALGSNLILNKLITGHAGQAAYQVAIDRQEGPEPGSAIPGLGLLRSLLLPMGVPTWAVGSMAFRKYWLTMGPIVGLLIGQVALVPLLIKRSPLARALLVASVLIVAFFALSRMHDELWGGTFEQGAVHHSVPRYLTPVYLLAALPPLLFLGRCHIRALWIPGSILVGLLALGGVYEVFVHQGSSLRFVHDFVRTKNAQLDQLARRIPPDATVYTSREDKWLWSRFRVAITDEPAPSATSIERALKAHLNVFMVEPSRSTQFKRVTGELARRRITLQRVDPRRGVYRVNGPATPAAPAPPTTQPEN
jgi:hypothetical protein